jgi:DNA-binding response OmpR family regulator
VLIAEDEVHIARMLGTLLEDASMRVTVTSDGASALDHIRSDPTIELVILDLMMPEMSGLDVLRETRRRTSGLPVIVLTAKGDSDVRDQALTLGATELFIKPFSPRKLVSRVRELCGR